VEPKNKKDNAEGPPANLLNRTRSLTEFYTENAGMNTEINAEQLDKFSNPAGVEYDLGLEGAFSGFKMLVGSFCPEFTKAAFESNPRKPLEAKGFSIIYTTDMQEFTEKLDQVNMAWVISHKADNYEAEAKKWDPFTKACVKFHETGGALYIWADNEPYMFQANLILSELMGIKLDGNTYGNKTLAVGDPTKPGKFGSHLITSGITNLYEGITICFPPKLPQTSLQTIATSTDGNPVILCGEQGVNGYKEAVGRIVVDCGFTKLFCNWDTAGTARYIVNASVWLLGLEHRMRNGLPLSRVAEVSTDAPIVE